MSDIRANTISNAAGTGPIDLHKQSAAKAWVKFSSSSGSGVAVKSSFNISSITDLGVGSFVPTLSSAMSDALFPTFGGIAGNTSALTLSNSVSSTTISFQTYANGTLIDAPVVSVAANGELA